MSLEADLLRRIDEYCRAQGVAETTFGRRTVNDGKLVERLRGGKSITLETLRKIEAALSTPVAQAPVSGLQASDLTP